MNDRTEGPKAAGMPLEERRRKRRQGLQRGVVILPSAFTLANLFFGVYAIVAASRGDFIWAGWFIVFAAILDMLDGRIARFTRTGSNFGAELDSLVDAISFGVAPGYIIYQLHFHDSAWGWVISFLYITAVVTRLARFNVEQGGEAKRHFHGLPSPTAGMILATLHPFTETALFQTHLTGFEGPQAIGVLVVLLAALMLSHVPYPLVPKIGLGTVRGIFVLVLLAGCAVGALAWPRHFIFPFLLLYTGVGLIRSVGLGLLERLPDRDPLLDEGEDEGGAEVRSLDYRELFERPASGNPSESMGDEDPEKESRARKGPTHKDPTMESEKEK